MLLDRTRVKRWQKVVFGFMVVIMVGFLVMIPVSGNLACGGQSSAQEQLTEDIAAYEATLQADPDDVTALRGLADAYVLRANQYEAGSDAQLADWRRAVQQYEKAAAVLAGQKGDEAKKAHVEVLRQMVDVHLFLQDYEAAAAVYGRITTVTPKDAQAYFDWATIAINAGDTSSALLAFGKFLELEPDSSEAPGVKQWIKENSP